MPDPDVDRLHEKALDAAGRALQVIGGRVLADAVDDTPLDEGSLRASGHVEPKVGAERTGDVVEVSVVFDEVYAAAQEVGWYTRTEAGASLGPLQIRQVTSHWRARHYSEPGTGPRYLENALKAMEPRFEALMAAAVAQEMERG